MIEARADASACAVCFDCRPLVGWISEDFDADGDRVRMAFCSEKCKEVSEKMRKCEAEDLLYNKGYKRSLFTPDAFQAAREAHVILQAYERRHLEIEPYKNFPLFVTPVREEYAKHVKILDEPALAEDSSVDSSEDDEWEGMCNHGDWSKPLDIYRNIANIEMLTYGGGPSGGYAIQAGQLYKWHQDWGTPKGMSNCQCSLAILL